MYLVKTPSIIKRIYKDLIWQIPSKQAVYLSFDDGPDPELTPWVLDLLQNHQAKASFFLIGENAERHPDLVNRIKEEGHSIGNHSHTHRSGWSTSKSAYLDDVARCQSILDSPFYRPPFGRMKTSQRKALKQLYKIVMWDIMSGDFDESISKEQCLDNVLTNYKPGSIILFHDTKRCADKLQYALPRVLDDISDKKLLAKPISI